MVNIKSASFSNPKHEQCNTPPLKQKQDFTGALSGFIMCSLESGIPEMQDSLVCIVLSTEDSSSHMDSGIHPFFT